MAAGDRTGPREWVLLSYRMPREPSTPRIAVWRKLDRLGVARLGDGLVALPADARTREQLEWLADEITDGAGNAMVWLARPASLRQERDLAQAMQAARAAEYAVLAADATAALDGDPSMRAALLRRLRGELRRVTRRDFFPPAERDTAEAALAALAAGLSTTKGQQPQAIQGRRP